MYSAIMLLDLLQIKLEASEQGMFSFFLSVAASALKIGFMSFSH